MNLLISNLDLNMKNEDLKALFAPYGAVQTAEVMIDGFTDQSRGFGYVDMPNEEEARKAIESLHQSSVNGKTLSVAETAQPKVKGGSYKVGSGAMNVYRFRKN